MTVLKRRAQDAATDANDNNGGGGSLAVAAFEYLEVNDLALLRLSGTWSGGRGHPVDMALAVRRAGGTEERFAAMADGSTASPVSAERAIWQVAFTVPVGLIESRSSRFTLHADGTVIELPAPRRHQPRDADRGAADAVATAPEEDIDPEARKRQAEAAIAWTQRQLARERDARRKAEEAVAAAQPEIEARRRELEHVAALERQVSNLAEERQRRADLEKELQALAARVRELSQERSANERLKAEISALASERDRLLPLEQDVHELRRERDVAAAERDRLLRRVDELVAEGERLPALEARVAELEQEAEGLRAERERLRSLAEQLPVVTRARDELAAERDRLTDQVERLSSESTSVSAGQPDASQLEAERERATALEQQVAELSASREQVSALEQELAALREERAQLVSRAEALERERADAGDDSDGDRVHELEERLREVTAERDELAAAAPVPEQPSQTPDPQPSVDRERVYALEAWVSDLRRALSEARDEFQASESAKSELRAELSRVRAEASADWNSIRETPDPDVGESSTARGDTEAFSVEPDAEDLASTPVDASRAESGDGSDTLVLPSDEDGEDAEGPAAARSTAPSGEPATCTACDALGSCRRCGGRGRRFGRRCVDCDGTGACSSCGGVGYIWVESSVASGR